MERFYKHKFGKKDLIFFLILIPILIIISMIFTVILLKNKMIIHDTIKEYYAANIFLILLTLAAILMFKQELKNEFSDFKESILKYTKVILKGFIAVLILKIILGLIFNPSTSTNDAAIEQELFENPIFTIISSVIIAPILEEIIFRLIFFNHLGNRFNFKISFVFSSLIFALMHFSPEEGLAIAVMYLIPTLVLPITYYKSKNFIVPLGIHVLNNLLATIFMLF